MPELPEVETIRRQLAPHLEGRTLTKVDIRDYRWTLPIPPELIAGELTGARIERLGRLGKYMIWELDGDRHLLVHLRMTSTTGTCSSTSILEDSAPATCCSQRPLVMST
jgi:formamidopyrimidine-DNA glycosylase